MGQDAVAKYAFHRRCIPNRRITEIVWQKSRFLRLRRDLRERREGLVELLCHPMTLEMRQNTRI